MIACMEAPSLLAGKKVGRWTLVGTQYSALAVFLAAFSGLLLAFRVKNASYPFRLFF